MLEKYFDYTIKAILLVAALYLIAPMEIPPAAKLSVGFIGIYFFLSFKGLWGMSLYYVLILLGAITFYYEQAVYAFLHAYYDPILLITRSLILMLLAVIVRDLGQVGRAINCVSALICLLSVYLDSSLLVAVYAGIVMVYMSDSTEQVTDAAYEQQTLLFLFMLLAVLIIFMLLFTVMVPAPV